MFLLVATAAFVSVAYTLMEEMPMPPELLSCLQSFQAKTNITSTVGEDVFTFCLNKFLWKADSIRWIGYNVTEADLRFISSITTSLLHRGRTKRQTGPGNAPGTGFRVRREYRMLSDAERNAFHTALNEMKRSGQYDTFARLHSGIVVNSAHGGPNFFGWHRVYLSLFEEALRRINRNITLPYWDSTMDFDMTNPSESILWSSRFLGNGDGVVTSGPFANWNAGGAPLTRNIGGTSRLFSKQDISNILSRCRTREISERTALPQYSMEFIHGGPHNWVGGQMSGLNTAAFEPTFFLLHAFVDYIWELFRIRQRQVCNVNPSADYPTATNLHASNRAMDGLPGYRNIDGYANYWTQLWYNYESAPTCSRSNPSCGSPYLLCDQAREVCVSRTREAIGEDVPRGFAAAESSSRSRMHEAMIDVGPRFSAPPSDGRSADVQGGILGGASNVQAEPLGASIEPRFNAPPSDRRTEDAGFAALSGINSNSFHESTAATIVPRLSILPGGNLIRPIQNTFLLNGVADTSKWSYVPIQVIHSRPNGEVYSSFPINGGMVSLQQDVFSTEQYPQLKAFINPGHPSGYEHCKSDPSGAAQIYVQSDGINYNGRYADYAVVDARLPVGSGIVYMGIKQPSSAMSDAIFSAHDRCGRMCQPQCLVKGSRPPIYKPCSGAVRFTSSTPKMYGNTFGDAIMSVWNMINDNPQNSVGSVPLVMVCNYKDIWPWDHCNQGSGK
ncbi:hypothetical protein CHS0354_031041 [Potamilus streckersoni]|uniref:Tyrosinase copper-binding domain-containing protein n=1 Tax=Potamilus streckersoni TaxID=2493646 RepID=A0AAE0WAF6_9BIVA|nr:hypothetical protein CHS0354_031041 [Potamilus streckersoni]